jgi:acyl CoA:acetate/3-ketoacid CoA transferase beta subunit
MAVIDVTPGGLVLREVAADTTIDKVQAATGAPLLVPAKVGTF